MNPEIVNLYIERLLKEIEELNKNRLLIETQLKYADKVNKDLQDQLEKFNKKIINKKEVNTSQV